MEIDIRIIRNMLANIGLPPHMKGFDICAEAIQIAVDDPKILSRVTGELYPRLANMFSTTPQRIERNIRTAICGMYDTTLPEKINRYTNIPCSLRSGCATNAAFIAAISRYFRDNKNAPLNAATFNGAVRPKH